VQFSSEGDMGLRNGILNDLWRLFDSVPRPLRKMIVGAFVVLVLMTFRYWRVMLPWEGFVVLIVLSLHFSKRGGGG
jgi:hypothetical protein